MINRKYESSIENNFEGKKIVESSAGSMGTAYISPPVQKIFFKISRRILWSDPSCTFSLLKAQTTLFYNLSPSLCPLHFNIALIQYQYAHCTQLGRVVQVCMFCWRYPGRLWPILCDWGWGWVCEFLRHQSFPSRWLRWATGPSRILHVIISLTLGDSDTATLHWAWGC